MAHLGAKDTPRAVQEAPKKRLKLPKNALESASRRLEAKGYSRAAQNTVQTSILNMELHIRLE